MASSSEKLKVGDWIEVRSKEDILLTLDPDGRLEGLPFMPQMFQFCGRRFQVLALAHKTCDVVAGEGRRLPGGVHLDTRCDGQAYDGCQVACLIFWKDVWLRKVGGLGVPTTATTVADQPTVDLGRADVARCTEVDVWKARWTTEGEAGNPHASSEKVYLCQATQVPNFTKRLAWWDVRQYVEDYRSGNVSLVRLARGFLYQSYSTATQAWRLRLGRPARYLYDQLQAAIGGTPYPRKPGRLPDGQPAPLTDLNLQPGELVRVKPHDEILATITKGGTNRGLLFDKEMVPFCGQVFPVKARVTTFVNERTGRLSTLKTPALILEGVWCQSRYSNNKMFCARALYSWWREVWLERVADDRALHSVNVAGNPPSASARPEDGRACLNCSSCEHA